MHKEDIEIAKKARLFAFSPYGKFQVGCALRTKTGKVYMGCNVENAGIQSICAERTAFVKAISEGEREFECITIVGSPIGEEISGEILPCGYCRQFIRQFLDDDFKIYTADGNEVKEYSIDELLPHAFKF